MAAIGQIRKHSGLLIGVVGAAMLLFVLGGALESAGGFFNGPNTEVGTINGKTISYQDFELKVAAMENAAGKDFTEQERQQLREQVWNDLVKEEILGGEYRVLGLEVTDQELMSIIKSGNNATLKQYFTDPKTGQLVEGYANQDGSLNGQAVIEYLKRVVYAEGENSAEALASWNNFQENYLRKPALDKKYSHLIAKGVYVTDVEVERTEKDNKSFISFGYVASFYNDMPDEKVNVTDSDLKEYYNQHKSEPAYEQKELTSSIAFVTFPVVASREDKEALRQEIESLKEAFRNAKSDTLFVNENSDTPFNIRWYKKGMFPLPYDSIIPDLKQGEVAGPFLNIQGDKFELVKITAKKMGPDSVRASHILIPITESEQEARATIDSLKMIIEENDNFSDMAMQYSQDPGSAAKGGDLDWFTEGRMVPEFNQACFNGKVGDLVVVQTQFGFHLIKITDQTKPKEKVLVSIVDNIIEPSQTTYEKAYNDASTFAITNDNAEKFMEASELMNRLEAPNLHPGDMTILGRPNTRKVVRWVFESKVGEVSEPFEGNKEFIVALVTEVREKGILPLEIVEDQVRAAVIRDKKAEILKNKMNNPNIKELSKKMNIPMQTAADIQFSSFSIPGLGNEQKLLGKAFSLETGQVSKPIDGDRGVYVILIENKRIPESIEISEGTRAGLMGAFLGRASYEPFSALKQNSEIVDKRYAFF